MVTGKLQLQPSYLEEQARAGFWTSLRAVWCFAVIIFVLSGLYFYVVTGVAEMLVPAALVAAGVGVVGTVKVIAAVDIATRRKSA